MSAKLALIIANTEYTDSGLAQLSAPGHDAEKFARVLRSPEICQFDDVRILLNQTSYVASEAIDEFFDQKKPDDLLMLYFSGHGVRDELGSLYLAVKNTNRFRLRSTAIKSDFIREAMDQSRSKRQILILDCCNSGAFAQGTKAATGMSIGTRSAFEGTGYGRVILTASDSTQFAWEGDRVIGKTETSLFTHFLVEGLEGEADLNSDGRITIDELYDYAYRQILNVTPKQTPSKWSYKEQGEIILREHIPIENVKPMALPEELIDEIEDARPYVRHAALEKLEKLARGKNLGLARTAREALEKMAAEDDSIRIRQAAVQTLMMTRQELQKTEPEPKASQQSEELPNVEEKPFAPEKEETQQHATNPLVAEKPLIKSEADTEAPSETQKPITEKAGEEREATKDLAVTSQKTDAQALRDEKTERRPGTIENLPGTQPKDETVNRIARKKPETKKFRWLPLGVAGLLIVFLAVCGYTAASMLLSIIGSPTPVSSRVDTATAESTQTASSTEAQTELPPSTSAPTRTPRPTPTPTPQAQQFFTEEFDSQASLSNWESFSLGQGSDTNLVIRQEADHLLFDLGSEDLYVYYMYSPREYRDVSIRLNAQNQGRNNNNVSLVCRMNSEGTQWYEFSVESGGLWYLYAFNGKYNTIANGGTQALKQGKEVNEYGMTCDGNQITLFVNGTEVRTLTENEYRFTNGLVGFNISSLNVLPITVEVNWFKISQP